MLLIFSSEGATVGKTLPLPSNEVSSTWPITLMRNGGQYIATVSRGQPRTLQAPNSRVSLDIPEGTDGVYMSRVRTKHINLDKVCIIVFFNKHLMQFLSYP